MSRWHTLEFRVAKRPSHPFSQISVSALHNELCRRQKALPKLANKRAALASRIAGLDEQIAALGGARGVSSAKRPGLVRRGRRTPASGPSLKQIVAKMLAINGKMRVPGIIAALPKHDYLSASPNIRSMVGQALSDKEMFKRVERGVYTVA
jgi:hypothetical protein